MSFSTPASPTAATITAFQFTHLLSLYPVTVENAYKRNARLKDPKQLSDALEDDRWRYEELPRVLVARRAEKEADRPWLVKEELERLVSWKM